ncbi:MAG: caspase family protein, partial [Candidatus Aminicenantes bacterium]|nr:caspase family protein [Candidatus Aminicenantes bacterium]
IQRRFALLIGVHIHKDSYPPIPQADQDVQDLEELFTRFGYEVVSLSNRKEALEYKPTRENIYTALDNICSKLKPLSGKDDWGDFLIVYFSGHGVSENKKAYLVPSDAVKENLEKTAIDMVTFKKKITEINTQVKILFLDTCRSGIERSREGAQGMSPEFERHIFLEAEGTATLSACMRFEEAHNHDTVLNGVFTNFLLQGLNGKGDRENKGCVTFDDLKKYVMVKVRKWAVDRGKIQTPNAVSYLVGDPPLVQLKHKAPPVKKNLKPVDLVNNPFRDTMAIREPERFVGRKKETRRLWNYLQGGSVAIRGEPKIGKSSMMLHLARRWEGKTIGPINFDRIENSDAFYTIIAQSLGLESHNWSAICEVLEKEPFLLLLDELDKAPKRGITNEDLSHFRALCESSEDFRLLAVSRTPLKEVYPDTGLGSPFYNILQPYTLKGMNRDECLQLLEHPWAPEAIKFNQAACDELLELSNRHPFKLQRAAFHYYESLNDPHYRWEDAFEQDTKEML